MPLTTVTITGRILHPDNLTPCKGSVVFTPGSGLLVSATDGRVLAGQTAVAIGVDGSFTVALPATDNAGTQPTAHRTDRVHGREGDALQRRLQPEDGDAPVHERRSCRWDGGVAMARRTTLNLTQVLGVTGVNVATSLTATATGNSQEFYEFGTADRSNLLPRSVRRIRHQPVPHGEAAGAEPRHRELGRCSGRRVHRTDRHHQQPSAARHRPRHRRLLPLHMDHHRHHPVIHLLLRRRPHHQQLTQLAPP